MRSVSSIRQRRSPLTIVGFVAVTVVVLGAGALGSLWALGYLAPAKVAAQPRPSGVPILLSSRVIPAYTKVNRDYVFDPKTLAPTVLYMSAKDVKDMGYITDPNRILGRVIKREKAAGYAFQEDDFFPDNTRPGVVAGIPPGKRMFVLNSDKIVGIQGLMAGDRFDLLATMPVDFEKSLPRGGASGMHDVLLARQLSGMNLPKRASVKVLIQNGLIVLPLKIREIPTGAPQPKGGPLPTKPVQEITIALDPKEVAALTEAMAVHAEIICVARSGQPDDPGADNVTPGSNPSPGVRTVETIVGGKRQVLVFPKPGAGPLEPAPMDAPPTETPTPPSATVSK